MVSAFSPVVSDRAHQGPAPAWVIDVRADAPLEARYLKILSDILRQGGTPFALRDLSQALCHTPQCITTWMARGVLKLESRLAPKDVFQAAPAAQRFPLKSDRPSDVMIIIQGDVSASRVRPAGADTVIVVTLSAGASTHTVGLQEVLDRASTVRFMVSIWKAGATLPMDVEVGVGTQFPFSWTRDLVLRKAMAFAGQCAVRLLQSGHLPLNSLQRGAQSKPFGLPGGGRARTAPWAVADYGLRMALRLGRKFFLRLTKQSPQWHIKLSHSSWREHIEGDSVAIPNPPGHFWADPFVVVHQGRTVVFVEDFVYARGLAHLSALEVDADGGITNLGACLTEDFHLSFPFMFRWHGELYMMPETHEARQIRVYRCAEFPLKWELAAVLKEGVSAADSILIEREGRWWMLTNIDSTGGGDHCSELHVFWADDPLSGAWTPHPANPVVCDAAKARNGGFLTEGSKLFRVSQMQSYGIYGAGYAINEIEELSETAYRERTVYTQRLGRGVTGAHHVSSDGGWSASDELRWQRA